MIRVITIVLSVNAVLFGGEVPEGNGDVNGDGQIDLTDTIYLLSSLYLGGPAPVAIACPPVANALPPTGQLQCYGSVEGQEIPCRQAPCQGQDGQYAMGCAYEGRFVENIGETVTDTCTGLMWQWDTADVNGDRNIDENDMLPWCDALAYCLGLWNGGYQDWRLPNIRELQSIVDYGRMPAIDPMFLKRGYVPGRYWSSTSCAGETLSAWYLLSDGTIACFPEGGKYSKFYVRAVRGGHAAGGGGAPGRNGDVNGDGELDLTDAVYLLSHLFLAGPAPVAIACPRPAGGLPSTGQAQCYDDDGQIVPCGQISCEGQDGRFSIGCPPEGRFVDQGDGTISDTCTGLMWQKDIADVNRDGQHDVNDRLPWCEALAYCENLIFAGHDDWRLPNVKELQSIVDYGRFAPAIDPAFGAATGGYWSSTSKTGYTGSSWLVGSYAGDVSFASDFSKPAPFFVRAVRGG
jgi:uncharacterized protein DUF1566